MSSRTRASSSGGVNLYARYINDIWGPGDAGGNLIAAGNVSLVPLQIPFTLTIDRVCIFVNNSAGNVIVGIYRDNGDTPQGGALLGESASTAIGTSGRRYDIPIGPLQLTLGLYWLCVEASDAALTLRSVCGSGSVHREVGGLGFLSSCYYSRGVYGSPLTDPCPALSIWDFSPAQAVRVLSIP